MPATTSSEPIPTTMSAIVIDKTGGTEVLQFRDNVPVPKPGEDEVLVKNEFIGINYIDTYFRTGLYAIPSDGFPYILGREAAGTLLSYGPLSSSDDDTPPPFPPGTRVAYLAPHTYAQYTCAPLKHVCALPDAISTEEGAAALLQGLTALTLVSEAYSAAAGDTALVHAAAGGVGLWLVQLLKEAGVRVIGTASTEEKRRKAHEAGAHTMVDSHRAHEQDGEGLLDVVMHQTEGRGCDAVLDGVGKDTFDVSLECVARKGTLVSFGNASGKVPDFSILRLGKKNVKICRPVLNPYIETRDEFEFYTSALFQSVGRGVKVPERKVYDLRDAATSHEDIEGRRSTGKLLLKV